MIIITNYEKIINMNINEMAKWLDDLLNDESDNWNPIGCYHCVYHGTHHCPDDCGDCEFLGGLKQWLERKSSN